jgi:hypothetical protein
MMAIGRRAARGVTAMERASRKGAIITRGRAESGGYEGRSLT